MTDEKLNEIIHALDMIGREYDGYEYGLPIHCDDEMVKMREAIRRCTITPTPPVGNYWTTGADDDQTRCTITHTDRGEVI